MTNCIDELTRFLLQENKKIKELEIFSIYNLWARQAKNRPKDEKEVIRCLALIKQKDILFKNSNQMENFFKEENANEN